MAASPSRMRLPDPPAPTLAALSDDLLADILIRVPTLADLGRASMVCVAFHRVISGHSFLRRLRSLHPLPFLGIMLAPFIPAQPPHPCATLARAITPAAAADFRWNWCSFVPSAGRWRYRDFRDGRVLLSAVPEGSGVHPGYYNHRALIMRPLAPSLPSAPGHPRGPHYLSPSTRRGELLSFPRPIW